MNRWLLAAILSSAVIPSAAQLVLVQSRSVAHDARAASVEPDVLLDAPAPAEGEAPPPARLPDRISGVRGVARAGEASVRPVLLASESRRAPAEVRGVDLAGTRLSAISSSGAVIAGRIDDLAARPRTLALGEELARTLRARPGHRVRVLAVSSAGGTTRFLRCTLTVVAVLRSGLGRFDSTVALASLDGARNLCGSPEPGVVVEAWLRAPRTPADAVGLVTGPAAPGVRARHRSERDWPREDAVADGGAARSSILPALVVVFLVVPCCWRRRRVSYGRFLSTLAPVSGLAVVVSMAAAIGTAAIAADPAVAVPFSVRTDLGRLFLAVAFGLLMSHVLIDRLGGVTALVALAVVAALATSGPASSGVVASASRRAAVRLVSAARSTAAMTASGPVVAVAQRGGEATTVELVGVDPGQARTVKLLRVLTGGRAIRLRPPGTERPRPWASGSIAFADLLDQLATHGTSGVASPERAEAPREGPPPLVVLGDVAARAVGAKVGDLVTLTAMPDGVSTGDAVTEEAVDPPLPVTFRVAAVARLGLRSVDRGLAIADTWQVEALGGETASRRRGAAGALRPGDAPATAAAPFAGRARRLAVAAALQVSIVAFLLGGLAAGGRRRRPGIVAAWIAAGTAVGVMLGYSEAASGMIAIADTASYEALPEGQYSMVDVLIIWAFLPGMVVAIAGLAGYISARKKTV